MLRHAEGAGQPLKGDGMSYTRREFGKLALAGLPAAAVLGHKESIFGAMAQAKPNSVFNGVQVGTITYSYRQMLDQSAEATLKYVLDSGISAIEIMGGPVESFAGAPAAPVREAGAGGRGAGRGPGGGRAAFDPTNLPPGTKLGEWHGQQCAVPIERGEGGGRAGLTAGPGGGRRGGGELTPEQQAAQAAQREYTDK